MERSDWNSTGVEALLGVCRIPVDCWVRGYCASCWSSWDGEPGDWVGRVFSSALLPVGLLCLRGRESGGAGPLARVWWPSSARLIS